MNKQVEQGLAKVSVEEGKLVIEALVSEDVKDGIYLSGHSPSGGFRLGVVLCNSTKNLLVTKEAESMLESLFLNMKSGRDAIGDMDWYADAKGEWVFSWFGENKKVLDLANVSQLELARGAKFRKGEYVLID